jgi:SAM-dependent methyltransferase
MHEILRNLPAGARVLDLGSREGSFPEECCPGALIVRLDTEPSSGDWGGTFVQADAARLPFCDGCFDSIVANHSLEHVDRLPDVLREIGRVVRRAGGLYVAVPDASTLTDKLYRWIYHGGGHINPFRSSDALARQIASATELRLVGFRILCSSFGFLERRHFHPRPPRRLWLLGNGNLRVIVVLSYVLRVLDRVFGTRTSVYGWAFYFGEVSEEVEETIWTNVCVYCGAGHSAAALRVGGRIRSTFVFPKSYNCPNCGAWNLFTEDKQPRAGTLA